MTDVTVNINDNGPYEISGPITLKDADGNEFSVEGDQYLCRCGSSGTKPFCERYPPAGRIRGPGKGLVTRHCQALPIHLAEHS